MDKIKAGIVGLGFGKHIVSCVMSCMLALFVPAAVSTAASSISGEVWVDANADGIKQIGEERVADAGLRLYYDNNDDGFCERMVQYETSSASGAYVFAGLTATGLYQVGIDTLSLPDDLYRLTARDQGGDENEDNDVDLHTLRTEIFQITSTDLSVTNLSDAGFLQGSSNVSYEGTATVYGEPTHYWKYQDLEFYLQDFGYDPVSVSTMEIITRWIKWYAIGERILQETEVMPGYLDRQRYDGSASNSVKRFNTVDGLGSFAAGANFISSGIPPQSLFEDYNNDATEHNLMFYETTRGANPIWKYRATWPHGGRLTHHGIAAMIHVEILGAAAFGKIPVMGGWTPVEDSRLDLWEVEGKLFRDVFLLELQAGGGQAGLPDQFEHDNHYGIYGGGVNGSRDIFAAVLVRVLMDYGREKVAEVLHNMSTKSHYAPSRKQALINFRDAVNDALDGAYAASFTNDWGFPADATYTDSRAVDSGSYPGGDVYLWDCKPHNYDAGDIRPGYRHLSDRTTQGFGKWVDNNGTSLKNLGAVDRLIPSGDSIQYPNDRAYLVMGEGVDFVQQISNGSYRVELHTVDNGTAYVSFPNDQLVATTTDTFGVDVTDGELNIRFDGITRVYELVITKDDTITDPTLYFREEFDGYTPGSIVGQAGSDGVWAHVTVNGTFELGSGLSGTNGLVIDSSGQNDLKIALPDMLASRVWMSYLYNESAYGGHFYVELVGHPWSNVFGINNVPASVNYSVGQTYRVVALFDYEANSTLLWINPDPLTEPVTDPSAPGYAPALAYDGLVSDLSTLTISSFCDGIIDDIRLANNYTDVVEYNNGNPPDAPGLVSPTNTATNVSVHDDLEWNAAGGATGYGVYLWKSADPVPDFGNDPPTGTTTAALTYDPGALASNTEYSWLVRATNAYGSSNSVTWTFTTGVIPTGTPYGGTARPIAGRIEAEDYNLGGEGIAYHDTGAGNSGGQYRTDDVDIGAISGGGYNVGWTANGEWMHYTVDVTGGIYDITARVSSFGSGPPQIRVLLDAEELCVLDVPDTDSWTNWKTTTASRITVPGGNGKALRLEIKGAFNFDWIEFTPSPPAIGVNLHSAVAAMGADPFDDVADWTDVEGVTGTSVPIDGGAGATVTWVATGQGQFGSSSTPEEKLYHGYLDDGGGVTVTLTGLKTWLTNVGFSVYRVRVYTRNGNNVEYSDIQIKDGSTVLDTIDMPTATAAPGGGTLSMGDSQILMADTITIDPVNDDDSETIAGIRIIADNSNAYLGYPVPVTDRIECEDYDLGGEGIGYHDNSTMNSGGQYRTDDVDIRLAEDVDEGYQIGWTATGEWLDYTVDAVAGNYRIELRALNGTSGSTPVSFFFDGALLGAVTVPPTGYNIWVGADYFQTLTSDTITVPRTGIGKVRLAYLSGSANVNWFRFLPVPDAPTLMSPADAATDISVSTNLAWSAATAAAGYGVYLWKSSDPAPDPSVDAPTAAVDGLSYGPGGLDYSTGYSWLVQATNAYGSSDSVTWAFTTEAAPNPSPFRGTVFRFR
jgi:hypothetical protein